MSRFLRCQPPSLTPCSTAVLLHFVAAKLCNVSVTAFGAHPVPPPWACGHWAPCPSLTMHSSFSVVVLSALCGYSPFHFILHILLWQPFASYIFYYYVCLSACGKYTPWPPLVPQCLPVPAPRSLPGLGQAKRWNARLERLVGLPRFTVRWLFEWWRRRWRRAACKAHKAALWCQLPSNCHAQFESQAAKPMNVTGKCALNCYTFKCELC